MRMIVYCFGLIVSAPFGGGVVLADAASRSPATMCSADFQREPGHREQPFGLRVVSQFTDDSVETGEGRNTPAANKPRDDKFRPGGQVGPLNPEAPAPYRPTPEAQEPERPRR